MESSSKVGVSAVTLAAILALSGLAACIANAAENAPRWTMKNVYLLKGEEKKLEGKNTERLLLEIPNKTTLGLEFPNGKCTMEGKIEGSEAEKPGTKKELTLDCNSVIVYTPKTVCTVHGVGQTAGLLKTKKLKSTLVWRNSTAGVTEDLITAETGGVIAEFEVEGAACPAEVKGKYVVEKELLDELKPTGEEQQTGTILLPEPALFEWWNNAIPRVKKTITQLAVSGTQSLLRGAFSYELEGSPKFGIFGG